MTQDVIIPEFVYTPVHAPRITTSLESFQFRETASGSILTGSIPIGLWTMAELCQKLKRAMEDQGDSIYEVRWDPVTSKVTITSDGFGGGNDLEILSLATPVEAWPLFGFTTGRFGADVLTHVGDVAVPTAVTLTLGERIRRPEPSIDGIGDLTSIASGARWGLWRGAQEGYKFMVEFNDVAAAQGVWRMIRDIGDTGDTFIFRPDSTIADGIRVHLRGNSWSWRQDRVYRHYLIAFDLLAQVPPDPADAFTIDDLIDRGPTS